MQTRPGFRIELVAAEPLVESPVALDFDENGRMFVVEFPEYNQNANRSSKPTARVRLLEDTNGDGQYDKSTLYVDDLDSPVAVACWDGGVFVGAVPDILYCKDTKGDGQADCASRSSPGSTATLPARAMLNSFRWGLDNRFHVSTSLAGGDVRPADDARTSRRCRCAARASCSTRAPAAFELTSGGGQHGMSMDDWGRNFVCGNSDPVNLMMYDGRYLARNPYLQAAAAAVNIAPDGKYTKLYRASARWSRGASCAPSCGTRASCRARTRAASRPASSPGRPA